MLGGVDCSFVIWHHANERNLKVHDVLQYAIDAYSELIRQAVEMGFPRVMVVSPPLPTMGDSDRPESLRGQVAATQLQRTALTREFNAAIEHRCRELGAVFIDLTGEQLDPDTGLIAQRFVRPAPDHHLAPGPYRALMTRKLSALGW